MQLIQRAMAATVLAVGLLSVAGGVHADEQGSIKYRQALMNANAGHAAAVAQIASGGVAFQDQLKGHAHALAEVAKWVAPAFKEKALAGKTRAKEEIWSDWNDFESKAKAFADASAKVSAAADAGDMAAVGDGLNAVFDACKSCHKKFRKKDY